MKLYLNPNRTNAEHKVAILVAGLTTGKWMSDHVMIPDSEFDKAGDYAEGGDDTFDVIPFETDEELQAKYDAMSPEDQAVHDAVMNLGSS